MARHARSSSEVVSVSSATSSAASEACQPALERRPVRIVSYATSCPTGGTGADVGAMSPASAATCSSAFARRLEPVFFVKIGQSARVTCASSRLNQRAGRAST